MHRSLSKMFSVITILALMLMALPMQSALAATTVAQWNFESPNPADATDAATYPNAIAPAVGTGNAGGVHASVATDWTTPVGNGSADSFSSNTWAVGDYYQFSTSTSNFTGIQVSWDQASSGTGPRDFKLAYSTDGTNFTDFGSPYMVLANASPNPVWNSTTSSSLYTTSRDLSAITAVDDQANVYFRLIDISTTSASGGTVGTGGTNRVDNFVVSGTPIVVGDSAPSVSSTVPTNVATNVAVNADIEVTFSEPVNVTGSWFTISCGTSSTHTATVSGGPTTFTLNPDTDFANSESCTVTIVAAQVTDQDSNDPPDNMAADSNFSFTTVAPPIVSSVIINEIDADNPSTDTLEFVELYDGGAGNTDLSGLVVVFYNGSVDTSYAAFDLDGFSTNASGYFLLGNSAVAPSIVFNNDTLQNGQDAVALYGANASNFPNGTAVTTTSLIDAIVYDTADADDLGLLVLLNAGQPQVDENGGGNGTAHSNQRCPNGSGGARNTSTYAQFTPSAGVANNCANDNAPSVTSTNPASAATNVSNSANIDITFSENVNVSGSWFGVSCGTSGTHTATVSGGPTTFTLDPDTDFVNSETCTVTVVAAQVADQDTNDPPNNMTADFGFSFTTVEPNACDLSYTPVYDIQGTGTASPLNSTTVTTQAVVVGDFQGATGHNGFYLQDLTGDGNVLTSDGVFVFVPSANPFFGLDVAVGDVVRVTGRAIEFNTMTEVDNITALTVCGNVPPPAPTEVDLPETVNNDLEHYEGMLITIPETLTVDQNFFQGRYGQVTLSADGRLFTPTNLFAPASPDAIALADENARRLLVLDDGRSSQNPNPIPYIGQDNTLRAGDTVSGVTGVLDFGPINSNTSIRDYRLQPTVVSTFTRINQRTTTPENVAGNIKVASFNVLNYFNGNGLGGGFPTSRGANTLAEFERQRAKIIAAVTAMDADVIGLMELENDAPPNSAIEDLVAGLNAATASGTYSFINTGVIGTDEIKVALLYKPAKVTPVGNYALLTSAVDPDFIDTLNRPVLAQTFEEVGTRARFTVAVNHLKSKGSACAGDPDTGDGQGNCNQTRVAAAQAEVDWLASDPTGSGDPDFIIIGDLNAYALEDPITVIRNAGYMDLIKTYMGNEAYSYVFDGQAGYLDHALATVSLASQVTGVTEWHINADEPSVIDYNTEFKPQDLYQPTPYRSSDHDPVIIGLNLSVAPVATDDSYTTDEDTALNVAAPGVLSNDTDGNNDSLTAVLVSSTINGMLTLNADGSFSYTPAANYNGSDSFTYKANDGSADSNIATVTITVNAVNDAPVAANDSYSTNEDTALTVAAALGVLSNDSDVDGNSLTAILVSGPSNGTLTLNADGSFTYSPASNYNGADSFTYKANDGNADSNVATVSITVSAVNDAPVATPDSATVAKNGSGVIYALANDYDVDGDPLTVISYTQGAHGTVKFSTKNVNFRYTPAKGFTGTDTFTYTIDDGNGGTATTTVTITVQ